MMTSFPDTLDMLLAGNIDGVTPNVHPKQKGPTLEHVMDPIVRYVDDPDLHPVDGDDCPT